MIDNRSEMEMIDNKQDIVPIDSENMRQFLFAGCLRDLRAMKELPIVFDANGRPWVLCPSCKHVNRSNAIPQTAPMTIMPLPQDNVVGMYGGRAYILGPEIICDWCRTTLPELEAKRRAREAEEEQAQQPAPPRGDAVIREAIAAGREKYGNDGGL